MPTGPSFARAGATALPHDHDGRRQGRPRLHGISRTPGEAFVLSGHAFLMNVHEELCPSGPYLWRYDRFFELLTNLGLAMQNAGTLTATADPARRAALEERLRGAIDAGVVCSLLNMEHQLLLGYDEDGFMLAQPWGPDCSMTPARLSFGIWQEFRDGPPVTFFHPHHLLAAAGERRLGRHGLRP